MIFRCITITPYRLKLEDGSIGDFEVVEFASGSKLEDLGHIYMRRQTVGRWSIGDEIKIADFETTTESAAGKFIEAG